MLLPSHRRPIAPAEQWLIDATAKSFLSEGEWPKVDRLTRNAAREKIEIPDIVYGTSDPDFLWRPDNEGNVVLSLTGLSRSSTALSFVEKFLNVVLRCRDIYLSDEDDSEDPPKITSADLKSRFGFDDFMIRLMHKELQMEYFLTRGGGPTSGADWYYYINHSVGKLRHVETLDQYFEERAKIVAPRSPNLQSSISAIEPTSNLVPATMSTVSTSDDDTNPDPRNVFVVFGRDLRAKEALWEFLEAIDLHPLNWNEMVRETGKGTPYTGQVVEAGFAIATVCVVLLTPDDEARLHEDLLEPEDVAREHELTCQPRPNVMFEAGRAFATHPDRTIIVEIGALREASDLAGLNVVRIGRTKGPLMALADRLEAAGCPVNRSDSGAFDPLRFTQLPSRNRKAKSFDASKLLESPVGRVIPSLEKKAPIPCLEAKIWEQGRNRLLEIVNRGEIELLDVEWEIVGQAPNWHIVYSALPKYPIPSLGPHKHIRIPVAIAMGGPVYVDLKMRGYSAVGVPYEIVVPLSIYG
jgi:predicted nucleotide-binding protein